MGRRTFSREFKISAVSLVQQQGYRVVQAAKSLGVDPASLRSWLKQFPADGAAPDSDTPPSEFLSDCAMSTATATAVTHNRRARPRRLRHSGRSLTSL